MGFYVLSNNEGTYITKSDGRYVQIRSFNQALKFPNLQRAMTILNNSVSKTLRNHYIPEFHETAEQVDKTDVDKQSEICFRPIENNEINSWQDKIKELLLLFGNTESRFTELTGKLSNVDREIADVQHYIEFGRFNCYQGWICFKMMQNLLRQRRQYKNELQVLQKIKECKISKDSIDSLCVAVSDIQNKLYTPRKFHELFSSIHNNQKF